MADNMPPPDSATVTPPCEPRARGNDEMVAESQWASELSELLSRLEYATGGATLAPPVIDPDTDNLLVKRRLGTAACLFAALKCKYAAAATHGLNVALICSAWARSRQLETDQRDRIEVAALLHDVGIIGVPDCILLKPGKLEPDEALVMARARQLSQDILRAGCVDESIIEIVGNLATRYEGAATDDDRSHRDVPLGSRMIAIAEAYDSMTTDHVFRPAMSQERALAELRRCAGTQFDPALVEEFVELLQLDQQQIHRQLARSWLQELETDNGAYWRYNWRPRADRSTEADALFRDKLLDHMRDAVVFIDSARRIIAWNRGAEQATGMSAESVTGRLWAPELLMMRDEEGVPVRGDACPVRKAITSGIQSLERYTIRGRRKEWISVDVHVIPVTDRTATTHGIAMMLRDASSEESLEERCQSLRAEATRDPLTQVANRAEFERAHAEFVLSYQRRGIPCSLIICDLDHFKKVNDNFGHQAGDDVIVCIAHLLEEFARPGDLVARYGGEEFVLLCADCDLVTASRRAETIRRAFARIEQTKLGGRNATASFGVTQIQQGDSAETMLRRADRALLIAKDNGRNRVIQLGSGCDDEKPRRRWAFWRRRRKQTSPHAVLEDALLTPGPLKVSVEKLRGFVADHQARVLGVYCDTLELEIDSEPQPRRRKDDRIFTLVVALQFSEEHVQVENASSRLQSPDRWIRIHVRIALKGEGERRRGIVTDMARQTVRSLRAYLMAVNEDDLAQAGGPRKIQGVILPWHIE